MSALEDEALRAGRKEGVEKGEEAGKGRMRVYMNWTRPFFFGKHPHPPLFWAFFGA